MQLSLFAVRSAEGNLACRGAREAAASLRFGTWGNGDPRGWLEALERCQEARLPPLARRPWLYLPHARAIQDQGVRGLGFGAGWGL